MVILFLSNSVDASSVGLVSNSTWQDNLKPVKQSSVVAGDIDNDGDLDLIITGYNISSVAKVYINNGTSLVENSTWQGNLTGASRSSLALGDIDNDGRLDLVLSGCNGTVSYFTCDGQSISKVYINNGTSLVENSTWQGNLTSAYLGSLALTDINNDGKMDLSLTGQNPNLGPISKVYINNGTSLVENSTWQQNLIGTRETSIALGDIDNDGRLDLVLSGGTVDFDFANKVYINNGTSLVENSTWQQNLAKLDSTSIILGDIDNDGDLDTDIIGTGPIGDSQRFYSNNGTTFVLNQSSSSSSPLYNYYDGSIAFGDYTNDGYLDLASNGKEAGERSTIYTNNGTSPFFVEDSVAESEFKYDDMQESSLLWVDIDNDGDLDMISTGMSGSGGTYFSKVYINNITTPNTVPNPPTNNFSSSYANGKLTLSWGNGSDDNTSTMGLYYNLRVGTSSGSNDIVSGVYGGSSNPTAGYFGNMMQRKNISLAIPNIQPNQTYYWSIQTIDTGLANSSWSTEQNYTTPMDVTKPTITLNNPVYNYNTTNTTIVFNTTVYDNGNLTNVTLWGSWGGWHANETNSSGINNTDYIFTNNLTGYGDGDYTWQIEAYDNSTNYQLSAIRTFTIDTTYPMITLISPSNASTWSSSSTVTFTYNVSDVRINNCSLIIDGAIDQNDTSIAVNTDQTFTKSLSNGNYNWSINCTDTVGYINSSSTRQLTVSYTPPSDGNGGGNGVGGGISGNVTHKKTQTWTKMTPGVAEIMKIDDPDIGLTQINITVKNQVNDVKITVTKLDDKTASIVHEISGKVYRYIEIEAINLEDENISLAKIQFQVNKSWISENNIDPDTIALNRYTTQWKKLPTERLSEDTDFIYYESETPGFTTFAIVGEVITVTTTTVLTTTATSTTTTISEEKLITERIPIGIIALIVIVIVGIIAWKFQTIKGLIGREIIGWKI